MNIQKARYKDRFLVEFNLPEDIMDCCTVKLILQPLLENAIYYGVGDMDVDDGGKIIVSGGTEENGIYLRVEDNGFGMPEETAEAVLTKGERVHKHGSGVGLVNVHNRIRLLMGEQYGLSVESEEDKGRRKGRWQLKKEDFCSSSCCLLQCCLFFSWVWCWIAGRSRRR